MADFDATFTALSKVLRKHSSGMSVKIDAPDHLYVEIAAATPSSKARFFGAVQIKKSYVSYHLMPIYEQPALLNGISEGLGKKMQGKSCFNFTAEDQLLFKELDALTKKCEASVK